MTILYISGQLIYNFICDMIYNKLKTECENHLIVLSVKVRWMIWSSWLADVHGSPVLSPSLSSQEGMVWV